VRRLVLLVGAIVLVDTTFYAAITPLLPELARELGLGKNGAGVLAGAYACGTLLGSLPAGWLAARAGVKPTVLAGLSLMAVSGLAFAFGRSIVVLDAARFLQGVGGACSWTAGLAWLASTVPRERRGQVLGAAIGAAIFGVQLGPVVGALATAIGQEAAFSSTVVFGAALAAWAWAMPAPGGAPQAMTAPRAALRDGRMLAGMWLTALGATAFGVLDVLAPLRLDALGATGLAVGVTFFLAAGLEAVVSPLTGRFTDRRGSLAAVRAGLVGAALGVLVLPLPGSAVVLAAVVVVVAGVLGIVWVPSMGLLSGGAEGIGLEQGFAFAFFNLAWAAGFSVGAIAGGGLAEATADAVPYGLVAALYAASAAVVLLARPRAAALLPSRSAP
jgi:predicted MFS family arabinose efflux permease